MRERFIPAFITLAAGAITCIIDIYRKADLLSSLKRLLIVIIIFYIIGLTAKAVIKKTIEYRPNPSGEDEEKEEADDSDAEDKDNTKDSTKDTNDKTKDIANVNNKDGTKEDT